MQRPPKAPDRPALPGTRFPAPKGTSMRFPNYIQNLYFPCGMHAAPAENVDVNVVYRVERNGRIKHTPDAIMRTSVHHYEKLRFSASPWLAI